MRTGAWPAWAVAVLLAGCAGAPGPAASDPEATGPGNGTAEADPEGGAIAGLVVNEEAAPVPRAQVALLPSNQQTTTDDAGRFGFRGVPAGSHTLIVAALGYQDLTMRVTVAAGETLEARFVLKALQVDPGPYYAVYPSTFYMVADWGGWSSVLPAIESVFCTPCNTWQNIAPAPSAVLIELDWTKSVPLPYFADELGLLLSSNPAENSSTSTTGSGVRVSNNAYSPREAYHLSETELAMLEKTKKTVSRIYTAQTSVAFQQRVHSWMATAYGGALPEGFTMLPPG